MKRARKGDTQARFAISNYNLLNLRTIVALQIIHRDGKFGISPKVEQSNAETKPFLLTSALNHPQTASLAL
jgi:hypothetical protein